jgi:MoxR-like ATPase
MSTPAPAPASNNPVRPIAVGSLLVRIGAVCHRARRPLLLIGPPGVGKSELFELLAHALGIDLRIVDLSLCEPSDLVGLPHQRDGRTVFAPPAWLPTDGEGIIVFEELNRAERFIQGPVLQLLTARRLNDYALPPGWSCAAAINPDDGNHDVRPLDAAMLSRFVVLNVCADRREWLRWARSNGVHQAVVSVVASDAAAFEHTSPRSWKHASDLVLALTPQERGDRELVHETLAGVLPESLAVVLAESLGRVRDGDLIAVDLLRRCATDADVKARLCDLRDQGRTDVLRALAEDLRELLASPLELSRLCTQRDFSLASFECLLALLPGDLREPLQDALAGNPAATRVLGVDFAELMTQGYQASGNDSRICEWQRDDQLHHRARLFVAGLCVHLRTDANLQALRRLNTGRRVLGRILGDLRPQFRQPLLDCLASLELEPILADRRP